MACHARTIEKYRILQQSPDYPGVILRERSERRISTLSPARKTTRCFTSFSMTGKEKEVPENFS
jgi:hypothetical protein